MTRDLPVDLEKLARDRERVESGFWDKLKRRAGRLPFLHEALAAYYCTRDPATPLRVKAILLGALAYFVVPSDLLPDFITGVGFTDDAAVLWAAISSVKDHIREPHRERAREALEQGLDPEPRGA